MLETKTRKQGNSIVITLPASNDNMPQSNQEYLVKYSDDGSINLVPKIKDPFATGKIGEFYDKDEWSNINPEGRELI